MNVKFLYQISGGKNSLPNLKNDNATAKDSLGFKPYVEAIVEFLTDKDTLPPITLSIEGQWGCGKSSFMKQLKELINKKNEANKKNDAKEEMEYFTVWFNAWKYDKEEELWASFALNFMDELSTQLSWMRRQKSRVKLLFLRYKLKFKNNFLVLVHVLWTIFSFILIFLFLFLVVTYILNYMGITLPFLIDDTIFKKFSSFILISAPLVGLIRYFSTEQWFIGVLRDPFGFKKIESNTNYKDRISFREKFYSDFNEIVKSYVGDSKVYVFIDDLDRCEVPKAAELMQAINLMISDDSKIYLVLGIDRKVISAGIAAKNEKVIDYLKIEGLEYGYDFIEKFIQLPFKVPKPKSDDFLKFLMSTDETETSLSPFKPMNKSSISKDFHPDESLKENSLSVQNQSKEQETEVTKSNKIEDDPDEQEIQYSRDCVENFKTSKLILEMVAPALDYNPRRIKQFINQFRFQLTIGKRTGLFSQMEENVPKNIWNCKKLAKFIAISIKWNSIIYALNSNRKILTQLQEFALMQTSIDKDLEKWEMDDRLINLLRYGCLEGENISKNIAEYTLADLDFSELLQISPVFTNIDNSISNPSPSNIISEMEFILIPEGEFMMGSSEDIRGTDKTGTPLHKVTIKNPFFLGKYPVTNKQWSDVMGKSLFHSYFFKFENLPVNHVSWNIVQIFIKELNEMDKTHKYRLPSEAEWEYACRAGTTTKYFFGDDESKLGDYAWYSENSHDGNHLVGQKKPNPWGLYDMYGNVEEFVQDIWHGNYKGAPSDGSAWLDDKSSLHVLRGGGYYVTAESCSSSTRTACSKNFAHEDIGFRLVREL